MRYNDNLKVRKGKIHTFQIASYDIETETKSGNNEFLLGGFIDAKGKYKSFRDKDDMIEYMLEHTDDKTMIYATRNSFDHSALFMHRDDFLKDNPLLRGSMLIHAKYKHMNFYDTKAYTKASVEELGKMLGMPKLKLSMHNNRKNMTSWEWKKLISYNKRDCEVTRGFILKLQEMLNSLGGELKMTIGSCAMDLYRRKYMPQDIHHEHDKKFRDGMMLIDFMREAYHGGRTEMFRRGYDKKNIYYYYDFNSLYPSVMVNEYPLPSSCHLTSHKYGKLNISSIMNFEGISDCEVVIPYMYYPMLPVFINSIKKLCFPIGKFRGTFTHIELRNAISEGVKITKIFRSATYTKTFRPFERWVNDLYALRLQYANDGNTIFKDLIKLIMNNLYGKFFQSHIKTFEFMRADDRNDYDNSQLGFNFDRNSGFGYRETPKESTQSFIIPIFAVYTTAYARLKIWGKLKELKGIYCDTDSVMTKIKMDGSDRLGEMKLEYSCKLLNIAKPKHFSNYNIEKGKKQYRVKGIRLTDNDSTIDEDAQKEANFIKSVTHQRIRQMRFLSLKEAIRKGMKPNQKVFITKKIDLNDKKRVWIKPYSRRSLQDSEPLIAHFDDVSSLMNYYHTLS